MLRNQLSLLLLLGSAPALAQQTTNNAVTQSEDAFGRAVGTERIGIYSNEEVRGFNPTEAGNNRLEGLYIDQTGIISPRLLDGSTVKVGYAARGTPFPAPTGIVDQRMEQFTGVTRANAEFEVDDYSNVSGAVEAKIALSGDRLGMALGVGFREADQVQMRNGSFRNFVTSLTWLPTKDTEATLFSSGFRGRGQELAVSIFPSGSALPPRQPRKLQQSQPWALTNASGTTSGAVVKTPLGKELKLEAGLFYTHRQEPIRFVPLLLGTDASGRVTSHVVLADRDNKTSSISGELRVTKTWNGETLRHSLIASVRGRDQDRVYGGQARLVIPGITIAGVQNFQPEPPITFGPKDRSNVRQFTFGFQYNLLKRSGTMLSVAAQKAIYRKSVDFANAGVADTISRDSPWLFSANGAWAITPKLTAYGGYVRGLEESAVAPDIAINRNEGPPALHTRQIDFGLRYAIKPGFALIAGLFEVKKPYFAVDAASRFTNLGTVSNRGIELSLAGSPVKGITIIAGGILVDPKISGAEVEAGRVGARPIGSFKARGIFNLDWKPSGQEAWSFDVALERVGPETADRLNTFTAPAKGNLNLGARYRFALGKSKILLRGQVQNVFNSYGWRVSPSGGLGTNSPRIFYLQGIIDF